MPITTKPAVKRRDDNTVAIAWPQQRVVYVVGVNIAGAEPVLTDLTVKALYVHTRITQAVLAQAPLEQLTKLAAQQLAPKAMRRRKLGGVPGKPVSVDDLTVFAAGAEYARRYGFPLREWLADRFEMTVPTVDRWLRHMRDMRA